MRKKDFYKMKNVIVDYIPFSITPTQINEAMKENNGKLVVKGVLQRAEAKNQNGRVYPREILMRESKKYDENFVKQKIGRSMREIRDALNELDKTVKMNLKLKTELNMNSKDYWKNTHKALTKISERLVKMANKVGNLK